MERLIHTNYLSQPKETFDFKDWQTASQWLFEYFLKKGITEESAFEWLTELEMTCRIKGGCGDWRIVTVK